MNPNNIKLHDLVTVDTRYVNIGTYVSEIKTLKYNPVITGIVVDVFEEGSDVVAVKFLVGKSRIVYTTEVFLTELELFNPVHELMTI